MMKILMMEGNPLAVREKGRSIGVRTATEIYMEAVRLFDADIEIDIINGADGDKLPQGLNFSDYSGMIISGSSLRAFEDKPEVTLQIEILKEFSETGKPILGSCWGLQIAAIAAGGEVCASPNGREIGIARKISLTKAGIEHPFMANKPHFFDAPCIHYDEVSILPDSATLLCSNDHSVVQGAIIPLGKSEVWGVQYHPEFDLGHLIMLYGFYKNDLLEQGFVNNEEEYHRLVESMKTLALYPDNKAIAWQLNIDEDILSTQIRAIEIANWLRHLQ
ncbi:MAG: type 1 glutamine amidotransferase [Sinobacterium sp.]|jgi:GMP synthase (glutamine-hydrolysing)